MSRKQALATLAQTRTITTGMLRALGMTMEHFLAYAQMSPERQRAAVDALLSHLRPSTDR